MAAELPSFSVPSKPARASRAGCSGPFAVAGIDWGEGGTSYLAEGLFDFVELLLQLLKLVAQR